MEADVTAGLPQFTMVGYLTSEVREAQERVRTALRNSGFRLEPKKITVNLAPADIRKSGAGFDLPIAIAVLTAYGYLEQKQVESLFLAGELSLDGTLFGCHGILGMVSEARRNGCRMCIIPDANLREGAVIQGIDVYGASDLETVVKHLISGNKLKKMSINIEEKFSENHHQKIPDFRDVRGQHPVKRAAEIAAAGMHNLLISGPPGSGKTMIAQCIPGILPPIDTEEALEVSQIHSVAGILSPDGILTQRPFRRPHHTISAIGLAGGGTIPRPGEISLAHRGVLYLDELPEFQKDTLEILRQPLEEGKVYISRNSGNYVFPADFMLVASRNPCKCGFYPDRSRCKCSEGEVLRYLHRISRPLLDRIDIHVEARQMKYEELMEGKEEEPTAVIRQRVLAARELQKERFRGTMFRFNADLTSAILEQYCELEKETADFMSQIYEQKHLTARAYHRLIKVARTIADLDQSPDIGKKHISEAILYRPAEALM